MSTLGKVLAFANILGAIGFATLAALDYAKRQSWEYVNLQHDVAARGIQVSDGEQDPTTGRPLELSAAARQDVFGGQNPVTSQVAEVKRVKQLLDGKLQSGDPGTQAAAYAAVLEPLAETGPRRQALASVRANLADEGAAKKLHDDLAAAHRAATGPQRDPKKSPADALTEEVFARGGDPKLPFVEALLAAFKEKPDRPFDEAYAAAVESIRADLQKQYEAAFAEAADGTRAGGEGGAKPLAPSERRAAVARLLIGLAETVAAAESGGQAPPFDLSAAPYKRIVSVIGLEAALAEVTREAEVLNRMAADQLIDYERDGNLFAAANARAVELARDHAAEVAPLNALVAEKKEQVARQTELAQQSGARVEDYRKNLQDEREQTGEKLKKLRELSGELYKYRIKLRDASNTNQRHELDIRELEQKRR